MQSAASTAVSEQDELRLVEDAYRAAVHEERLAGKHHGHVSLAVRERLQELRHELRQSLRDHERQAIGEVTKRLRLLAEVDSRLHFIQDQDALVQTSGLVRIHESIARLRDCQTPRELIAAAPAELCKACGFTRAMVSRVRGSVWVPEILEIVEGVDPEEDAFREYVQSAEIQLAHMLLETELVRRRIAVLVTDPVNDPRTHKGIVAAARSPSYVAAPIMPTERVIGFFHADRFGQDLAVTPQDRDNLWVFADHFGLLYERAVLVQRLETQRIKLRDALTRATVTIDELYDADIELARYEEALERVAPPGARDTRSRRTVLVTAREREVLELMADGLTNAQIAEALVVSEGTVKSHLKRIFRKLHVSNRVEAVACYYRLVAREDR